MYSKALPEKIELKNEKNSNETYFLYSEWSILGQICNKQRFRLHGVLFGWAFFLAALLQVQNNWA